MVERRWWITAAVIATATVAVYWNTLENDFVNWDDPSHIYENELVIGDGGLSAIWLDVFNERPHRHYYPLVFTTFWIEYQLVGFQEPLWLYHANQLWLHALNAVLLLFLLHRLGVTYRASAFAAALFALHPVNVASVAWITERKNTLSGVFFLLALLLWLAFRKRGGYWRYGLVLLCFVLAVLSKSAVLMLAPILVITDRHIDGRWSRGVLLRSVPFFVIGAALAAITTRIEAIHARSGEPTELLLRPLIAARAIVHYVWKLIWPVDLLPVYPRWPETFDWIPYWLSLVVLSATVFLAWRFRARFGDTVIWASAVFLLTLFPMLGFRHFNYLQSTFVSDHFVYLSAPWAFLVAGIGLVRLGELLDRRGKAGRGRLAVTVLAIVILFTCSGLTIAQNRVWRGPLTFWQHTLAGNPNSLAGRLNLGNHYRRLGDYTHALEQYAEAARIDARHPVIHLFSARCARYLGRDDLAITHYRTTIRTVEAAGSNANTARVELAEHLAAIDRIDAALTELHVVLESDPDNTVVRELIERLRGRRRPTQPRP